jgi:hypothetical protein
MKENSIGHKHRFKTHYKGCSKYLHRFDELIMKPIFIYRYERDRTKSEKKFFELMLGQGEKIEQEFVADEVLHRKANHFTSGEESGTPKKMTEVQSHSNAGGSRRSMSLHRSISNVNVQRFKKSVTIFSAQKEQELKLKVLPKRVTEKADEENNDHSSKEEDSLHVSAIFADGGPED